MKKPFDGLNEHYLIPAVLATGLLSMAMAFYFFHQWSLLTSESTVTVALETKGTVSLMLFLMAFTVMVWKNRWFSTFYLTISITCLYFIFS